MDDGDDGDFYLRVVDMVAVCILSHGDEGVIISADGQRVTFIVDINIVVVREDTHKKVFF